MKEEKSIVHKTIDQENKNLIFQINIKNQILDISISDFIIFLHKSGSGFTEILEYSFAKKIRASSNPEKQIFVEFDFEYSKFINDLKDNILEYRIVDVELLYNIFLKTFINNWKNCNNSANEDAFVTIPSPNRLKTIYHILDNIRDPKILIVNRSVEGRSFSNALHMHNKGYQKLKFLVEKAYTVKIYKS